MVEDIQRACAWLIRAGLRVRQLPEVFDAHPAALRADPDREWLPKVQFLHELGLTAPQIERMIRKHPAWLVGVAPEHLPAVAAQVHQLGVPRDRLPSVLCRHPAILSRSLKDLADSRRVLGDILQSPGEAATMLPQNPQLLALDLSAAHEALLALLRPHGLIDEDVSRILSAAPELLSADPEAMAEVLDALAEQGVQGQDMTDMAAGLPRLLTMKAGDVTTRLQFLLQIRGKPHKEVIQELAAFPQYFNHSLCSSVGPRLSFLRTLKQHKLQGYSLATLLSRSDYDFAELVCNVLVEDYLVYKAQWERTLGLQYGWRPKVRSVVRPRQTVGAEGRFAIV